ncbi:N-formylglutamate amidohydrolase [Kordiimonas sediminis]|uniref:N-formylglutamate amidohydrolase n=1 Tax=Kordiimonas sediminis TaxID=1735581 RepID=A0A919AJ79_9PROT|nr:N-formylglutamate amidohydrolase [Kordiimonas sediminis]GHF11164.1 N-formylglutamate amidohydrolase [Kordiimonas sediminis]
MDNSQKTGFAPTALHNDPQAEDTVDPYIVRQSVNSITPFLFTVPHSGRHYPARLLSRSALGAHDLRRSEDAFVDLLLEDIPSLGGQMIISRYARAYVDLNRAADELDPTMFHPPLDEKTSNRTIRVRGGLGVIPAIVAQGIHIYDDPLPAREADYRLNEIYQPYHSMVDTTLQSLKSKFGKAYLIDCHSMPSEATAKRKSRDTWSPIGRARSGPDIVLGDAWGESCSHRLSTIAENMFVQAGFSVRRNIPYAGGFATRVYGQPQKGIHALQIEINRSLYMNETTIEPTPTFQEVRARLTSVLAGIMGTLEAEQPIAAE